MTRPNPSHVLGGFGPDEFLRDWWQKQPLVVRQAIPGFAGFVDADMLFALAEREGVNARLVVTESTRPPRYRAIDIGGAVVDRDRLRRHPWTILVQGVESLVDEGWPLLRRFDFLPAARVDDLMISFATKGGSVGPHVDQYDVFLVQARGRRRWMIGPLLPPGRRPKLDPKSPTLRVLSRLDVTAEWILEPGDMLYLPPGVPHFGVAVDDECFTYSIGFLAPSHDAIVQNFLAYWAQVLEQRLADPDALYADPDLTRPHDRIAVDDAMVRRFARILAQAKFDDDDVADFIGRYLTGPKPSARFTPRSTSRASFANALAKPGTLKLALPSRGLVRGGRVFLNGDAIDVDARSLHVLRALIDERAIALPIKVREEVVAALHAWAQAGFLVVDARSTRRSRS